MTKAEVYAKLGIKAVRLLGDGKYVIENVNGNARPAHDGEIRALKLLLATCSDSK